MCQDRESRGGFARGRAPFERQPNRYIIVRLVYGRVGDPDRRCADSDQDQSSEKGAPAKCQCLLSPPSVGPAWQQVRVHHLGLESVATQLSDKGQRAPLLLRVTLPTDR